MRGLDRETELPRLQCEGEGEPPPKGLLPFEIDATSDDAKAEDILARAREVLSIVLRQPPEAWPTTEEWLRLLPSWFVQASARERSEEEERAWYQKWQSLSPAERDKEQEEKPWSVSDFIYWFEPSQRQWWWWCAEILSPHALRVHLAAEDSTIADEALQWLLHAAGAKEVVNQNLRRILRDS